MGFPVKQDPFRFAGETFAFASFLILGKNLRTSRFDRLYPVTKSRGCKD
jgi:hypothetical protein